MKLARDILFIGKTFLRPSAHRFSLSVPLEDVISAIRRHGYLHFGIMESIMVF